MLWMAKINFGWNPGFYANTRVNFVKKDIFDKLHHYEPSVNPVELSCIKFLFFSRLPGDAWRLRRRTKKKRKRSRVCTKSLFSSIRVFLEE
jgi:hypothetical protein